MGPKRNVPEGWLDYKPIKDVIRDAKIVAFKVPLPVSKFVDDKMVQHKWTVYDLMDYIPDLGLVIDLTYKFPAYYKPQDLLDNGVKFVKIGCAGHITPPPETLEKFYETIDSFLKENPKKIVGVHCTHGVNRTGYMICRYLVEKHNYSPKEALETFHVKRGYPVERSNYIDEIYAAYKVKKSTVS